MSDVRISRRPWILAVLVFRAIRGPPLIYRRTFSYARSDVTAAKDNTWRAIKFNGTQMHTHTGANLLTSERKYFQTYGSSNYLQATSEPGNLCLILIASVGHITVSSHR